MPFFKYCPLCDKELKRTPTSGIVYCETNSQYKTHFGYYLGSNFAMSIHEYGMYKFIFEKGKIIEASLVPCDPLASDYVLIAEPIMLKVSQNIKKIIDAFEIKQVFE